MQNSKSTHAQIESPIYTDVSLYKVIKTKGDRLVAIHHDGGASCVLKIKGINPNSYSEKDYENLLSNLQGTLGDFSENVTVTFTSIRLSGEMKSDSDGLPKFLSARSDNYDFLVKTNQIFKNEFYITIFVAPEKRDSGRSLLKKLYRKFADKNNHEVVEQLDDALSGIERRVSELGTCSDILYSQLRHVGMEPQLIKSKKEYYNLFQKFFRPNKSKHSFVDVDDKKNNSESPRQALFSGVRSEINKDNFVLDNYLHRVYSLDRVPKSKKVIFGDSLEVITNIPYEYIFSVSFRNLTMKESVNLMKWKVFEKDVARGKNKGAIVADKTLDAEARRINNAFEQFADGDSSGVFASVNLVVRTKLDFADMVMRSKDIGLPEFLRDMDTELLKSVFPKFGGSEWAVEPNTGWYVFLKSIPGFGNIQSDVLKTSFMSLENVSYTFPIYDSTRNIPFNGVNYFLDERGNSFCFDLHDKSLPAWNYNFSGETGSGKSVLVNTILSMQYAEAASGKPPVVCIIDVGGDRGSYTKLLKLVKGEYINLSSAKKPSIQVLELNADESRPTPSKIEKITSEMIRRGSSYTERELQGSTLSFYQTIADKGPDNLTKMEFNDLFADSFGINYTDDLSEVIKLSPGECEPGTKAANIIMSFLEIIISSSYRKVDGFDIFGQDEVSDLLFETYRRIPSRYPRLSDLLETIKMRYDQVGSESLLGLYSKVKAWTVNGQFFQFDQETNINLSNDTILVDLKGLESEPHLQAVYTMYFNELFSRKMYSIRGRRKLVVRDEAWSVVKNDKARAYFIEDMRTARKNGFATISVSQFPTDFLNPNPSDGRAILGNTQVFFIGKINESMLGQVSQELRIPEHIAERLPSYGNVKQSFPDGSVRTVASKFLVKIGKEYFTILNKLSPFENIMFSSSEEDNLVIDYYLKVTRKFNEIEDAMWFIARGQHIGDDGLVKYLRDAGQTNKALEVEGPKRTRNGDSE